jgi:predicted MFS family arabinose efflux permease
MAHGQPKLPVMNPWTCAWAGLLALAVAIGIGRFAFTPILPMMQDDSALTLSQAGWLASANYAGYLAGALTAGARIRSDIAIRAGLLIIGVSTLAMGLTQQFLPWLALRFIAGIASAWVLVFVSAWALERLAALGRPKLNGMVFAGVGTGIMIAGGACLVTMQLNAGSTAAWFSLGLLSIGVTALLWTLLGRGSLPAAQPAAPTVAPSARSGEYRRLVLCYGAYGFGYIIPATYLPAMAKEIVAEAYLFGWAWPAFGAAAVFSTLCVARLSARVSHRAAWIGSHLVMALGLVVPLVVRGLPGILAAALLVGGTFVTITMVAMQEARSSAGPQARALMAAMTSAFALGQIVGPLTVSLLPRGFAPALMLAASILVVSALFLIKGERRERTDAAPGRRPDDRRAA